MTLITIWKEIQHNKNTLGCNVRLWNYLVRNYSFYVIPCGSLSASPTVWWEHKLPLLWLCIQNSSKSQSVLELLDFFFLIKVIDCSCHVSWLLQMTVVNINVWTVIKDEKKCQGRLCNAKAWWWDVFALICGRYFNILPHEFVFYIISRGKPCKCQRNCIEGVKSGVLLKFKWPVNTFCSHLVLCGSILQPLITVV